MSNSSYDNNPIFLATSLKNKQHSGVRSTIKQQSLGKIFLLFLYCSY
ncbi:hypothetical protein LDVICp028 [lymphocystis disease virus-China]|uniref:Uncharacterized protein n=1 Tax=lymphocystis disease virus-China TaxID=256729 RepID=Q678I1_9VIRU|nr:hypothetical protein LDVICp028 [lymphocystis disease virus-China]AAU10876.1 hypothetical protein [lymphocystis disease virus-China]